VVVELDAWARLAFAGPDDPDALTAQILDHLARCGLFPPTVTGAPR
jgi:hypothetical protein